MPNKSPDLSIAIPYALGCYFTHKAADGSLTPNGTWPQENGNATLVKTYGYNVPDWKSNIWQCTSATSSLFVEDKRVLRKPGINTVYYKTQYWAIRGQWDREEGDLITFSWPSYYTWSNTEVAARSKFLKKARGSSPVFQGGVFLGELKETLEMLRNPAKGLWDGLHDYHRAAKKLLGENRFTRVKKRRPGIVRPTKDALANLWLENAFGWQPLISDVKDAATVLATLLEGRPFECVPVKGVHKNESSSISTVSGSPCGGTYGNVSEIEYYQSHLVKYKGAVRIEPLKPCTMNPSLLGFGSWRDFVPTIWELIPYSFLVDYFLNIGEVIDGWADQRTHLAWACRVEQWVAYKRILRQYPWTNPSFAYLIDHATVQAQKLIKRSRKVTRSAVDPTTLATGLYFRIPGLGLKWLNIAALASLRV